MNSLFDYIGVKRVKIIDVDGDAYTGRVVDITDKNESYETEDSITIMIADGRYIGFLESEIESIEVIE